MRISGPWDENSRPEGSRVPQGFTLGCDIVPRCWGCVIAFRWGCVHGRLDPLAAGFRRRSRPIPRCIDQRERCPGLDYSGLSGCRCLNGQDETAECRLCPTSCYGYTEAVLVVETARRSDAIGKYRPGHCVLPVIAPCREMLPGEIPQATERKRTSFVSDAS